ncbi:low-density lipoprotein receptor-related protein 6-like [Mytilus californianus]|uniref:low-density lipoprotein receptor-related protein 6-like n=1 Tax=Mytilus californianus TaxID=6549 RepID=UPI0022451065|nr:low-density lipoprotein receptor-related protein 6-like [Mytilus californianus]
MYDNIKIYIDMLTLSGLITSLCFCCQVTGFQNKLSLIFSTYGNIKELNLQTGEVMQLQTDIQSRIDTIDYDYRNGYIYFSRYTKSDIQRFQYPELTNAVTVTVARLPVGSVIDPLYNHVYWTERFTRKLYRCNSDGSLKSVILQEDALFALTLDYRNRWLYYSTDGTNKSIRRLKLNDSENQTIINIQSELVTGMSIDNDKDRLYWMEFNNGFLKSSTLNGSSVITVLNTNTNNKNQDIHVYRGNVYCANGNSLLNVTPGVSAHVIYNNTGIIYSVFIHDENHEIRTYT